MRNTHFYVIALSAILLSCLSSCDFIRQHIYGDEIARVGESVLYQSELDEVTRGATPTDSAQMAETYITQWISEHKIYDQVRLSPAEQKRIETMVENYRKSLYVQAYEAQLVEQQMPKHIDEDSIIAFYDAYPTRFILKESIAKGLLIVVPTDAPNMRKLRQWLQTINEENLEKIEKYAYQNASGYELFTEQWQTSQNIRVHMPIERKELSTKLKQQSLIEIADSVNTYLLRITDKRLAGEQMPLEYAQPEIERIILEQRQVHFLQEIRKRQ